ncbi:MAG: SMC-Scp complex subunit ScpB, partial [Gammaproteobacteria bacterium]|nr:SMC-Scp complex subunit ScpB [Gammaproteobacteria bacterium]
MSKSESEGEGKSIQITTLKPKIEALLAAANKPLSIKELTKVLSTDGQTQASTVREAVEALQIDYAGEQRGIDIVEVASGYRLQVGVQFGELVSRLWETRPPRYSRALLETLSLIAYRQPITRGEVEDVRGVAVSTNIIRTLLERGWVKQVGHKEVPGRPALYGTTPQFLDYFSLKKLEELPLLAEGESFAPMLQELDLQMDESEVAAIVAGQDADNDVTDDEEDTEVNEQLDPESN